jgi:hypothetical protein
MEGFIIKFCSNINSVTMAAYSRGGEVGSIDQNTQDIMFLLNSILSMMPRVLSTYYISYNTNYLLFHIKLNDYRNLRL